MVNISGMARYLVAEKLKNTVDVDNVKKPWTRANKHNIRTFRILIPVRSSSQKQKYTENNEEVTKICANKIIDFSQMALST